MIYANIMIDSNRKSDQGSNVTHSKSVMAFSSVTGMKERTFLLRPITHAVFGALANTRPETVEQTL